MLRIVSAIVLLGTLTCGTVRAQDLQDTPRPIDPPEKPEFPLERDLVPVGGLTEGRGVDALNLVLVTPPPRREMVEVSPFGGPGKNSADFQSDASLMNEQPVAIPDVYTTPEGVALVIAAPGHLANDYDPNGDTITWQSYTVPQNGTMSGTAPNGMFTYTPDPGFSGLEDLTYAISDGNGGLAFGRLLILVVDAQNRPPVAVPDVYTTPENVALTVPAPGHVGNDIDLDGDPIIWLSYTVPQHGTMSGTANNGMFTYTPDPGFSGLEEMTYAISDGKGSLAFGTLLINVIDDQNRPPIAVPDVYTTPENVALTVPAPGHVANDIDLDGDAITWQSYTVPQHGTMSGTSSSGMFTYTPDPGFVGVEEMTYAISDGNGGIAFGTLLIHVLEETDTAPVAISDVYTTPAGVPLVIAAPGHLANDYDPNGDAITWQSYTVPQNGTMSGTSSSGMFTYTPDPGFSGLEDMTYAISDGNGGIAFGRLLILVVDAQNRPPIAVPDVYTTPENMAITVPAPGHLANDIDLDGDPIIWLSYTVPQHGIMSGTASSGMFTYTPDPGFSGLEDMTYAISDGNGGIVFGRLLILVVDDQNRPPIAVPDVYTTPANVALTVPAPGHLANDIDLDGDQIIWLSYTVPQHGTMSGTANNGMFTYTPDPGFVGVEDMTYAISDGNGGVAFGKLLIYAGYDPPSQAECVPPNLPFWDGNLTITGGIAPTATVSLSVPNGFSSLEILPGSDNIGLLDISGVSPLVRTGSLASSVHADLYDSIEYTGASLIPGVTAVFGPIEPAGSRFLFRITDKAGCALQVDPVIDFGIPTEYVLDRNYPNPFNPSTRIQFSLPESAYTHLAVYDATGRLVKTLVASELGTGRHDVQWDGTDDAGRSVSSGVYFYRMESGGFTRSRSMTLVK